MLSGRLSATVEVNGKHEMNIFALLIINNSHRFIFVTLDHNSHVICSTLYIAQSDWLSVKGVMDDVLK